MTSESTVADARVRRARAAVASAFAPPPPSPRLMRFEKRTEWPLAIAALVFLAGYSVEVLAHPRFDTAMDVVMNVTWAVFVVDYVVRLMLAEDRARWFLRHLVDLAVVALPLLRPLRLLRLIVLIIAFQKAIGGAIRGRIIVYTASGAILLIYAASLALLEAERHQPNSHINSFGDAVWSSIETVTTVGYGDAAPVTGRGRLIAVALMIGGISLVGVVTATLASWIVQRVSEEDDAQQAATAAQIDALRVDLEQRLAALQEQLATLTETPHATDRHGVG
ncbi:voltage-gated potassium channel [Mycolicibacterium madagascariense]|uniref:Voltage-gated potassium channel n=2 Tax=Mycolicibacterium madagascariense TaxID=212765 RepID=A0A7I7XKI9_9MYCO|nr:voltage-gated potassium channel [Mycolicibacterium madagascariense]